VVADEVRKLAERTGKSTQEIGGMIGKIQQGTQRAVQEMEAGVKRVNEGVNLAHQAGDSVTGIRDSAERVTHAVDDISLALKEQTVAARDIAQKVERIAQGAEENSAAVAQTADLEPQITIVQRGDERIEEFRVKGRLYMIKVTPPHGKPYFLIDQRGDGQMRKYDDLSPNFQVPLWVIHEF
jgi:methyl-accepting chemotaxis protein